MKEIKNKIYFIIRKNIKFIKKVYFFLEACLPLGMYRFIKSLKANKINKVFSQKVFSKPDSTYEKLITIQGCGYSGSGALVDLMSEFDNCTVIGYHDPADTKMQVTDNQFEVDFMRLSGGILELERVVESNNIFIKDAAIKRFITLSEFISVHFGSKYASKYLEITRAFVKSLIDFSIDDMHSMPFNPHYVAEDIVKANVCSFESPFIRYPNKKYNAYFLKDISKIEYVSLAKKYIHEVLSIISSKKYLVLDQFLADTDPDISNKLKYFDDMRIILVYRDPRDVYATAIKLNVNWIPSKVSDFIKWYDLMCVRFVNVNHPNFLAIRFEDLVNNYDKTVMSVLKFIGADKSNHVAVKDFFDPQISIKNVGLYKQYYDREEIKVIEQELKQFCYQ